MERNDLEDFNKKKLEYTTIRVRADLNARMKAICADRFYKPKAVIEHLFIEWFESIEKLKEADKVKKFKA